MSTTTIETYRNRVLQELQEAGNSAIAALPSGQGTNGIAIAADSGMLAVLNEAKDELVKRALPVWRQATKTIAIGDGPAFPLSGFTATDCKAMRNADTVSFAGALLTKMSPEAFNAFYQDRATGANAAPKYWAYAKSDPRTIELQRKTATAGTLTVNGYGIPADATDATTGTFPFIASDDEQALVLYAAVKLCSRASDDERIRTMRGLLAPRLDALMLSIRDRVSPSVQKMYLDDYIPYALAPVGGAS